MPKTNNSSKIPKLVGSIYFILLGLTDIIAMQMNNKLGWRDFVLLAFLCTPLLVNKKIYYLLFGGSFTLLFAYFFYYVFNTHTLFVRGQYEYNNSSFSAGTAFTLAYIFTAVSCFFSVLLLRAGLSSGRNKDVT